MIKSIKLSLLVMLATAMISCSAFAPDSQQQAKLTLLPTSISPTLKSLATATFIPSVTPTVPSITPTQANNPACIASTQTTESGDWICLNQSYGFSIHLPSSAEFPRVTPDGSVEIQLQNSPSNSRVDRLLAIGTGQSAEWCFSPDAEKVQFGEHEFMVNYGFEPSGVVFAWKTYGIVHGSKKVCIDFVFGFREWAQADPLFPPEKDQYLEEVESILATFQWPEP